MENVRHAVLLWPLRVLLLHHATLVRIKLALLITILAVRRVPPLPTPPLSNAPLLRTKQLPPVMPDIMGLLVMPLVRRVPPLPTLPLSNAQMLPTKQLSPVMPDIMGLLAMPLAKRAMPVPLQIRALVLVQPRVLLVVLEIIL